MLKETRLKDKIILYTLHRDVCQHPILSWWKNKCFWLFL